MHDVARRQKAGSVCVTSAMKGVFRSSPSTRAEIMTLIYGDRPERLNRPVAHRQVLRGDWEDFVDRAIARDLMPQIDQQRERIQADLRGLIAGDVRCDEIFLQLYAGDASVYAIRPLGVVCPRSVGDVSACLRYAWERKIPVHPRGSGSGTAGGALGQGLVLEYSRYIRRIVHVAARWFVFSRGLS